MTNPPDIPPGFELMPPFGPSHEAVGPIYFKAGENGWIVGMRVEERHHNKGPILHGGLLAFFVDTAFTYACKRSRPPETPGVTTNLSIDYAGIATAGDWIEAHVDLMQLGRRVVFMNCFVFNGDKRIARASTVFQLIAPRSG